MKKWDEPKIYDLGLEMTMEGNSSDNAMKLHYCHKTKSVLCTDNGQDHSGSGNKNHIFTGKICDINDEYHTKNGNVACCCFGIS